MRHGVRCSVRLKATERLCSGVLVGSIALLSGCPAATHGGGASIVCHGESNGQAPNSQIFAGRPFGCRADRVRCDEAHVTLLAWHLQLEKAASEVTVEWSADRTGLDGTLHVNRPGPYLVRLLCRGNALATARVEVVCVPRPATLFEWMPVEARPGCVDRKWVCANLTYEWYLAEAAQADRSLPAQVLGGDVASIRALRVVYIALARASGCTRREIARAMGGESDGSFVRSVERELRARIPSLRGCEPSPGTLAESRRLMLDFTVGASGAVSAAGIPDRTSLMGAFESCIADRVAKWRFPAPADDQPVAIRVPLEFADRARTVKHGRVEIRE